MYIVAMRNADGPAYLELAGRPGWRAPEPGITFYTPAACWTPERGAATRLSYRDACRMVRRYRRCDTYQAGDYGIWQLAVQAAPKTR
jgi:hypothetical protein